MFKVEVCATSANLSVGFDVLGIALDLKNTFYFEKSDDFKFIGFDTKYSTKENNMVYNSYIKVFEILKLKPIPVSIKYEGEVPISRGLGSSSTLIVAGVMGANHILNDRLSIDECFNISAKIEGHPDNVAPAIYGGLIASIKENDKYIPIKYDVSSSLQFTIIVPEFELKTSLARSVLPSKLPYSDIVFNTSRIIHIPLAFSSGDIKLLKVLFNDKLHEPYRAPLIKGYDRLREIVKEDLNAASAISGSGSTMLVIHNKYFNTDKLKELGYNYQTLHQGSKVIVEEL